MSEGKPSAAKKPAAKPAAAKKPAAKPAAAKKPPAGKPSAGGKAGKAAPPEQTKEQKKKTGFKEKLLKSFSAFHGFWTPILGSFVIMSIAFFVSGIDDSDIIAYSLLIFVTLMILFYSWRELLVNNDQNPEEKNHYFV